MTNTYSTANTGSTTSYNNLEAVSGGSYTLGANDTLNLNNGTGTLYVDQGAVLTGNGLIQGNVNNSGLVRIPIVALSQVSGGYVQIAAPNNVITTSGITQPVVVNAGTYAAVGTGAGFGAGGSGGGGVGSGGGGITIVGNAPVVKGTFAFDASLDVTGTYSQTSTGALRLFIGGHDPGVAYSQLRVGQTVTLDGKLEVVLQPGLFNSFGYTPHIGDKFDFVTSGTGITLSPALQFEFLVMSADAGYLSGFNLASYSSGISSDPDSLYQILDPNLFSFALIDNGDVLEATLMESLTVTSSDLPEPGSLAILTTGLLALLLAANRKRSDLGLPCRHSGSSSRLGGYAWPTCWKLIFR